MTIIIRRKMLGLFALFLVVIFGFGFLVSNSVQVNNASPLNITVVVDAGHGGVDGGSVGKNGTVESELNLKYAEKLTEYLTNFGINVVNTRLNNDGLYGELTDDFKLVDMKKRADIINGSNAQILISIHMNKFTNSSENGAQVFFEQEDENSEKLANSIRDMLKANFENARELTLAGDYYILNNTTPVGVIVECGFLSNPEEEKLLNDVEYINKMCYSIYAGIINYLGVVSY